METKKIWNPYLPLSRLGMPENITKKFRDHAKFLYEDLSHNKQVVTLREAPYPYTGLNKIRVVENSPPIWYSLLYENIGRNRKAVLTGLLRIINSEDREYKPKRYKRRRYRTHALLRELIFEHLVDGYHDARGNLITEPDNDVKEFFGVNEYYLAYIE